MTANAGSVIVKVGLDDKQFNRGMSSLDKRLDGVQRASVMAFKAATVATAGFGVAVGYALKQAGGFEQSLNVFQAVSSATGRQMDAVSSKAKALGADLSLPGTSAKDAADAMTELAKGGLNVAQTMDAAKGVLQLSAAATIDNATAATIVARALKSFGLAGTEAIRVSDVLANAANKSTGEITDFALGLQQSSAVAKMTGLTLNETTAALMQLADAGIVGSDAGTSLKQMLMRLNPETKKAKELFKKLNIDVYDGEGRFVGYRDTVGQVFDSLKKLTQEQRMSAMQTLFGSDAIRAANVNLLAGTKSYDEYLKATQKSGTAAAMAEAKMKGFNGALEGLKSTIETVAIQLGEPLLRPVTAAIRGFANLIQAVADAKGMRAKLTVVWEGVQAAGKTLQDALGRAIGMVNWGTVWSKSGGIAEGLADRFKQINWGTVGRVIGDGIADSVAKAMQGGKKLADGLADMMRSIDWVRLGRAMGPGIVAAVASAIATALDPVFWIRNWDLALSVAVVVFSKGIGKIIGKLAAPIAGAFGSAILSALTVIERVSPLLASAILAGIVRLPALLAPVFQRVENIVGGAFGRLGRLAQFVVKVLGVQAALNAIVQFAGEAAAAAKRVGRAIADGIVNGVGGIASRLSDRLKGEIRSAIDAVKGFFDIFSPSRVTAREIGGPLAEGIGVGFVSGMDAVTGRMTAAVAKTTAVLARIQERRAMEDRQRAVQDGLAAVADAKKNGEGVIAAEQALARAREDIVVAGLERQNTRAQAVIDKHLKARQALQEKADAQALTLQSRAQAEMQASAELAQANIDFNATLAQAKLEEAEARKLAIVERAQERMARIRERFANAFGGVSGRALRGFDAMTGAFRTPGESALASIRERRQQEDAAQAVADAEARLAQVRANTESTAADIASAERALARAREDITITSLEKTAAAERTEYEARRENLRTSLEDRLAQIKEHFSLEGGTVAGLTKQITDTLASYGVDFATVGGKLGSAFIEGLQAAITAAGHGSAAVKAAIGTATGRAAVKTTGSLSSLDQIFNFAHGGIVRATPGGTIARIGEAGRDEAVIPLPRNGGLGGTQTVISITVQGSLIHERDLEDVVARAAQSWTRRNGPLLSRTAGATA